MHITLRCIIILLVSLTGQYSIAQSGLPQLFLIDEDQTVDKQQVNQLYTKDIPSFTTQLYFFDQSETTVFTEEVLVCNKLVYASDPTRKTQVFRDKIYRSTKNPNSLRSYDLMVKKDDIALIQRDKDLIRAYWSANNSARLQAVSHRPMPQIHDGIKICQVADGEDVSVGPIKINRSLKNNQVMLDLPISIEIDHELYLARGGNTTSLMSWLNGVFVQVTDIYAAENINLILEEIFIWDTPDPYQAYSKISSVLKIFGLANQNDFVGNATMLLSSRALGGGLAQIDKLCQPFDPSDYSGPYAVVGNLNSSIGSGMSYNQNTYLIAHELGHILGSRHSHACVWGNDGNQAIDNCWNSEGDCNYGQTPSNGGTMMSYCHLYSSIGVNFNLGFGDEPGALIYQKVVDAITCGAPACTPGDLCDDEDICTKNDNLDENCECQGVLIDMNQNGLCDVIENCPDIVLADTISTSYSSAQQLILASKAYDQSSAVIFNSGQEILLNPGFEIRAGSTFETASTGCGNN